MLIAPSPEKAAVTGKHSGESGCLPPTPGTVKKKSEEIKFAKLKRHKGSPLRKPGNFQPGGSGYSIFCLVWSLHLLLLSLMQPSPALGQALFPPL